MNIVLHGPQTALYLPEFDITPEVVAELNKVLPSVTIPPDGVSGAGPETAGGGTCHRAPGGGA